PENWNSAPMQAQREPEENWLASLPGFMNNAMQTVGGVANMAASGMGKIMPQAPMNPTIPIGPIKAKGVGFSSLTVGLTPFATGAGVLPAEEDPLLQEGVDIGKGAGEGLWDLTKGLYHMGRH